MSRVVAALSWPSVTVISCRGVTVGLPAKFFTGMKMRGRWKRAGGRWQRAGGRWLVAGDRGQRTEVGLDTGARTRAADDERGILLSRCAHPRDLGSADVAAFLAHPAEERGVSRSTRNQALSALLFVYRDAPR